MLSTLQDRAGPLRLGKLLLVAAVLALAFLLGRRASPTLLGLLAVAFGGAVILMRPASGLLVLVAAALVVPLDIPTGTEVRLNPVSLLIPALLAVWVLTRIVRGGGPVARSATYRPLALFLIAGLLSLLIGMATWDATIPRSGNFTLVQLGQWAIFAFSAGAYWLTANLGSEERWLRRMTFLFLGLGGGVAIAQLMPGVDRALSGVTTVAFIRAPFWALLAAVAGGQLLFNRELSLPWRVFLGAAVAAAVFYAFVQQQDAISNWVGVAAVLGTLIWLRFRGLRWPLALLVGILILVGVLFPAVYNFAGGDEEWALSGQSRIVLSQRVIEVTMRNPITGLGPAAYRPYANMKPLLYGRAYWLQPSINSHNNYVDLFSHVGLVGLALLVWFVVEIGVLGGRLHVRFPAGFAAGYVNGTLAAGAAALVLMMFADWILPFVYNIGFGGFQASVLVWLFLGGLVAVDNQPVGAEQ